MLLYFCFSFYLFVFSDAYSCLGLSHKPYFNVLDVNICLVWMPDIFRWSYRSDDVHISKFFQMVLFHFMEGFVR